MTIKNTQKGLTFVELIVSIGVISTGVMAAVAMITHAFSVTVPLSEKLTASYLVQEGMELVRRTRDSGWLQRESWEDMAEEMQGRGRIDYLSKTIESYDGTGEEFYRLYVDEEGFKNYKPGSFKVLVDSFKEYK